MASHSRKCWSCGAPDPGRMQCNACEVLQPPPEQSSHFDIFELSPAITLDRSALEAEYLALSRVMHPDFFGSRSAQEQGYSLEWTAQLNDAYRTLRAPWARVSHLLEIHGRDITADGWRPPGAMLMEVFELNEALDAMEVAADPDEEASQLTEVETRLRRWRHDLDESLETLGVRWGALDGENAEQDGVLDALIEALGRHSYVHNLEARAVAVRRPAER